MSPSKQTPCQMHQSWNFKPLRSHQSPDTIELWQIWQSPPRKCHKRNERRSIQIVYGAQNLPYANHPYCGKLEL